MTRCPCLDNWTPAAGNVVRAVVGGRSFDPGDLGVVVESTRAVRMARIEWRRGDDKEWLIPGEMEPESGHAPGCAAALVCVVDSTATFNGSPIYVTDAVLPYGAAAVIVRPMPAPTTCAATCAAPPTIVAPLEFTSPAPTCAACGSYGACTCRPPAGLADVAGEIGALEERIQRALDAARAAHDAGLAERIRVQLARAWRAELDQRTAPEAKRPSPQDPDRFTPRDPSYRDRRW